jgi:hypothetical protein
MDGWMDGFWLCEVLGVENVLVVCVLGGSKDGDCW